MFKLSNIIGRKGSQNRKIWHRSIFALFWVLNIVAFSLKGCNSLDDDRIPTAPVNIVFQTQHVWDAYGVGGAMQHKRFILKDRIPANFPYIATSATGFGGVLMVCDVQNNPKAFDLSCPVEARSDIRVHVDTEEMVAVCDVCKSTYDVFTLPGHPLSGPAMENGYGLKRYRVTEGSYGEFRVVRN